MPARSGQPSRNDVTHDVIAVVVRPENVAFVVDDVEAERDRLVAAGATVVDAFNRTDAGDEMAMLRDPWGFPIQLMKRAEPM